MIYLQSKAPQRKRRRTCWDRLRARMLESRRRRRSDPATSAVVQLLTLFTMMFGRMPLIPTVAGPVPYVSPPMSLGHTHRIETARLLGIPTRYVDVVRTQGSVPYSILFEHIRRGGRSREDAMSVLHQQAPESCRDWLDHIEGWGLWSNLLLCHVRGGVDEDTDVKLLRSTLAWLEVQKPDPGVPGPADAETILKPGPGRDDPDLGDDPDKPKP
jgi:hypothetical protein